MKNPAADRTNRDENQGGPAIRAALFRADQTVAVSQSDTLPSLRRMPATWGVINAKLTMFDRTELSLRARNSF